MPAQNASPAPVMSSARTFASSRAARTESTMASRISIVSAFFAVGPIQRDAADLIRSDLVPDHVAQTRGRARSALLVRMLMTETPEPRPPTLCWSAYPFGVSTWRSSASPRSCHQHSTIWATPVAPIGWPLASSPPEVLIGMRPVSDVSPSRDATPPLPLSTNPRSSMSRISVMVKQSCTSAQSTWSGSIPAMAYARSAASGGLHPREARLLVEVGVVGRDPEAGDVHGLLRVPLGELRADEQHGRRAVGLGAAVEQVQGRADGRRLSTSSTVISFWKCAYGSRAPLWWFFTATDASISRVVPNSCMWRVAKGANSTGSGLATGEDRVAGRGPGQEPLVGRLVAHLLDTDHEDDVVHAAGDRHRADAERVRP